MLKNILTSAITALVVALVAVGLVGGNFKTATLGDATGYSALAITGQGNPSGTNELAIAGSGTTTIAFSSSASTASCIQGKTLAGAPFTAYIGAANSWVIATSTTASCK